MRIALACAAPLRRLLVLPLLGLLFACPPVPPDEAPRLDTAPSSRSGALHAVLINGGERRQVNYGSHLQHIRELLQLLEAAAVDPAHITIFASDGPDPEPDLALRATQREPDFWLLPRSGVAEHLKPSLYYVNSTLQGFPLRPASREALRTWFAEEGARIPPDDTLLLYVTDHGEKNPEDLADNTISLWGESLSVSELRELLTLLDPSVRIVLVMSQCYSGSFAHAIVPAEMDTAAWSHACGYFATTADRLAYGCYPENSGTENIGHSHRLFEALREVGNLPAAHRRALVSDRTPDVPNRSSDFYLQRLLEQYARESGRELSVVVDELLREAWRNRAAWEPELRLLDRVGHAFGLFSPRSLAELDEEAAGLPELSERLETYANRWKDTLEALKRENWNRFLVAHPEWRPRFETEALRALDAEGRLAATAELLTALSTFTREDRETYDRLLSLKRRADDAKEARYRSEVRLGAVLRMRTLLTTIAGRVYLERHAEAQARFDRLLRCENLAFLDSVRELAGAPAARHPFPPLGDDRRLIESVMPSWMGIRYRSVRPKQRQALELQRGAARIINVYPDSPAEASGLQVADVILGPPEAPFQEPHEVREWIMRAELGRPTYLEILRDGERREVTLIPGPYPLELPKLPGPPKVGSAAPPLSLDLFRGETDLARPSARLLFFWATWCQPCKQSLPEVLAFAEQREVEIVAISDESPNELETFFEAFEQPFPELVASDPKRRSFQNYGVSGTPTFVLVDEQGVVRHYQSGYQPKTGLEIAGWERAPFRP